MDNVRWRPYTSERETGESDIDGQIDRQTGGHRVTVRIPSKKRGRITQHACRNRFRTLSLLDISIFFLSGRLARRVPRKMGVRIPHARGTRVCVRQKGCASLTTPFFAFSSQVFPFWRIPVFTERKERNREKERESSINRRRTYTSKAVRLHRSLANIRVPFHSMSKEGREDEEKRSNRDRKKEREENEGKGKNEKRREKTGKKRTPVEDLIDRLAAGSISLKSATRQRNCDGGHEQGQ